MAVEKMWDGTQWVPVSGVPGSIFPRREEVPSIEDIFMSTNLIWRDNYSLANTTDLAQTSHAIVFCPPYPVVVLGASIAFTRGQAADAVNYWDMTLRRSPQGSTGGDMIATLNTSAGVGYFERLDFQQYDPVNRYVPTSYNVTMIANRTTASAPLVGGVSITLRYARY